MCCNFHVRTFYCISVGLNYYYNDEKDHGWYPSVSYVHVFVGKAI